MTVERSTSVILLRSKRFPDHYTKHIADPSGYPLCKTPIKVSLWEQLRFDVRERTRVCVRCRRLHQKHTQDK